MTTLSEDLAAWASVCVAAAGNGGYRFDVLVARVRELEVKRDALQTQVDRLVSGTDIESDHLTGTDMRLLEAINERDAAYENGKRVWKDAEVWFEAMVVARRERDVYAKVAAEAQEHLAAALVREQALLNEEPAK